MSWFARIEEACAAFIEQTFARTFPTDVEPAHIARKLVATMEARTTHEGDRAFAPSRYSVRVHPEDYARLKPHQVYLEEEWAALLWDMAQLVSISLAPPLIVRLHEDPAVVGGAVEIDVADGAAPPAAPAQAPVSESRKTFALRMVKGLPVNAVYPVSSSVRIGRSRTNDIVISDPRISREHARIEAQAGHVVLIDLDSTNGTQVDGKRAKGTVALRAGSLITLGNTSLELIETPG
ncbi:MAG: DUF3662 and FHA domain-containing protein [Candidatus Eremiobacteraeota bacterium]|nr:DUF3662 and FHA domain-containing protein [Candidatus Eremiobacteraeota bacterium]